MDFSFSDEQEELRRTVRAFLERRSTEADVRRLADDPLGHDPEVWRQMAEQLGLHGLAIPEQYGGSGFGLIELGVVLEEMGRALLCAPFFSSAVLAATALQAVGDAEAAAELLPGIATGQTIATVALPGNTQRSDPDAIPLDAVFENGRWRLSGRVGHVTDGISAHLLLLPARTPDGVGLFAVDATADRLVREELPTLDQSRRQAALTLTGTRARLLGTGDDAWPALRRTHDIAAAALAAEQVGGAAAVLDMAVEYATTRRQFGRAIGGFQAIKHRCADMFVDVETARATVYYALLAAATDREDLPLAASAAKAFCSAAYTRCAEANVQVHGGIGFTWEHRAHLYLKRAKSSEMFLGSPSDHLEAVAVRAGY